MPGIIAFPTVVEEAVDEFGWIFANTPERWHFAEYLTGLLVAERKNVAAINAEFAQTTDQSCLNRWITQVPWDVEQLNEHRLAWLQRQSSTRYSARGVIAIDNTLVDHSGQLIEDVGWFWDHADKRHLIAHDYLIANYVCASGQHYPLEFRRFRKRDTEAEESHDQDTPPFKSHTDLFKELVDWVVARDIPGDFTFDCYFTSVEGLNHMARHGRGYVGDLKSNRKVVFNGRQMKATEVATLIEPDARKPVCIGARKQWYFTKTVRLPEVDHPVRLVILWDRKNGMNAVKFLITSRVHWEIIRILNVYRNRWTGTETFHRDGKQHLGMGDCQLRNGEGQTRHMYLVMLAYSLLMARMQQSRASGRAQTVLTTIGEACRAVSRETLSKTLAWAVEQATTLGWKHQQIIAHLALA
jgi:hypothetical protein